MAPICTDGSNDGSSSGAASCAARLTAALVAFLLREAARTAAEEAKIAKSIFEHLAVGCPLVQGTDGALCMLGAVIRALRGACCAVGRLENAVGLEAIAIAAICTDSAMSRSYGEAKRMRD
mmetsp:Transcript_60391/g.143961  ORF Transcript_60391/g.143961 Transcript_60391/m.143961 type:complete len:121 (+) Transcript_60391:777-1139(+)